MGERWHKAVIRGRRIEAYYGRTGAQHCFRDLLRGAGFLAQKLDPVHRVGHWTESFWIEGGYLVDFADEQLWAYSADKPALAAALDDIGRAWPGWVVRQIGGWDEARAYVDHMLALGRLDSADPAEPPLKE